MFQINGDVKEKVESGGPKSVQHVEELNLIILEDKSRKDEWNFIIIGCRDFRLCLSNRGRYI